MKSYISEQLMSKARNFRIVNIIIMPEIGYHFNFDYREPFIIKCRQKAVLGPISEAHCEKRSHRSYWNIIPTKVAIKGFPRA